MPKIFVCIKQVPDTEAKLKIAGNKEGIEATGIKWVMNPYDEFAVEEAIKIRDAKPGPQIFVISVGPKQRVIEALRTALAMGADTYKLKFGHRGSNQPVKNLITGRVHISSQNHGYAVSADSIDKDNLMITHVEVNDGTVEGLRHKKYPAFSVQFHPDATPGPHDEVSLFDDFMSMIDQRKEEERHA